MPACSYATVDEYETRYGDVDDREALAEVLMDASRLIESELERAGVSFVGDPGPEWASRLMQACRSVAHRAMSASSQDVPVGATQYSQSAVGYTESYTLGNPYGEVYLGKAERRMLGLDRQRVFSVRPRIGVGDD